MIKSRHMDQKVAKYITEHSIRWTPAQRKLWEQTLTMDNGVKDMCGSPDVWQLIQLLIRSTHAKRCVEVGCLTGLTTVAMAMALPTDGQVITIDNNEKNMNAVRSIWKETGVEIKIQVRLGDAGPVLDQMIAQGETGKIDMVLIDGDHRNVIQNFERAMKLCRPNGMIIIEGTLWMGHVVNDLTHDEETRAICDLNRRLREDKRIELSMLGISDGVTLCLKRE